MGEGRELGGVGLGTGLGIGCGVVIGTGDGTVLPAHCKRPPEITCWLEAV